MRKVRYMTLSHPWGTAALAASETGLCAIILRGGHQGLRRRMAALGQPPAKFRLALRNDPELSLFRDWLSALLNHKRCDSPPISPDDLPGTEFQKMVWKAMIAIPSGETRTYMDLAQRIGRPRAARAVGSASAANPIPPLIPCHRMVGSNGDLRGYADGLPMKRTLLEIERSI